MIKKKILITESRIKRKVKQLAREISKDFDKDLLMVCILKGATIFFSDLIREITKLNGPDIYTEFLRAKSYSGTKSSGKVKIDLDFDCYNLDVLLVEDIVDTGLTLNEIIKKLKKKGARSVKICSLLDKPSRRKKDINLDYLGFEISDFFVVGYGMDFNGQYRGLPYILEIREK